MKGITIFICFCISACYSSAQSLVLHTPLDNALWISSASSDDSSGAPCPLFRKEFHLHSAIEKAVLCITAHGVYEARINGLRVGKEYFMPGCTAYDKRLLYQTYDVTDLLKGREGEGRRERGRQSEIVVTVGDGWYRGYYGNKGRKNNFGKDASLLCKLIITYKNGSTDSILSNGSWLSGTGPIRRSDFYLGELEDNTISPGGWAAVKTGVTSQVNLQPYDMEPVTQQERFVPQRIFTTPAGETIVDFGQNMAGWVQLRVKGRKGDTVRISHGEILDKNGNFYMGNMTRANPVDVYVLNGEGTEILEPHFTYHGFRYARVEGFQPDSSNCLAIALHSDLRHSGSFSCSSPLINQLQHDIEWSLNSNLIDIPTDCDNRAERLGWTGDAQIIFPTMAFNRDVHRLFRKWLEDLALEQGSNGAVPRVIPDLYTPMKKGPKRGFAGWGDASTIVPMGLFEIYGDTAILQQQYPSMVAWVKYEIGQLDPNDHLLKDWTYGDWLAMGPQTGDVLIDQCYLIHSIELLLQARNVLGISDHDGPMLEATLQDCKKAFQTAFICKDGLLSENTQTACAMALAFDLLPDSLQPVVVKQLVNLIRETNDHLATGFLGTTYILQALSNHGQLALAYTLLEQETMPSWLYFVKQGATTLWEEWDAKNLNGGLCKCSFNQYAFGVVGAWLYSTVAGIRALSPGYQRILIEPHPGGDLTWAKGSYQCRYGTIVSEWKLNGVEIQLHVEIPPGTEAVIRLPGKKDITVPGGSYDYTAVIN